MDTHLGNPVFIYGNGTGSTVISSREDYKFDSEGYILSAYFENPDLQKGIGAIHVRDRGLRIIKNGKKFCFKNMDIEQVVINNSNPQAARILVRDKSHKIKEYVLFY